MCIFLFQGEGVMQHGHDVYVLLHPGYPHYKAGIRPGLKVVTFKSRTEIPETLKEESSAE